MRKRTSLENWHQALDWHPKYPCNPGHHSLWDSVEGAVARSGTRCELAATEIEGEPYDFPVPTSHPDVILHLVARRNTLDGGWVHWRECAKVLVERSDPAHRGDMARVRHVTLGCRGKEQINA